MRYPWRAMVVLLAATGCLLFCFDNGGGKWILAMKILLPLSVITTATMRFFHRNSCYRMIMNNRNKTIKFYLMFNQNLIDVRMRDVKLVIDRNINFVVNRRKVVVMIMNCFLGDIVTLLPEETEIEFVGFWGRKLEEKLVKTGKWRGGTGCKAPR